MANYIKSYVPTDVKHNFFAYIFGLPYKGSQNFMISDATTPLGITNYLYLLTANAIESFQ